VVTVVAALEATLLNNLGTDGFTLKLGSFGKFSVRHKPGILGRIPFSGKTILTNDRRKAGSSVRADCGSTRRWSSGGEARFRLVAGSRFLAELAARGVSVGWGVSEVREAFVTSLAGDSVAWARHRHVWRRDL
jgi:hypothetical protein